VDLVFKESFCEKFTHLSIKSSIAIYKKSKNNKNYKTALRSPSDEYKHSNELKVTAVLARPHWSQAKLVTIDLLVLDLVDDLLHFHQFK
jgi:hypothetical protein